MNQRTEGCVLMGKKLYAENFVTLSLSGANNIFV
jgi:hypothetical protein